MNPDATGAAILKPQRRRSLKAICAYLVAGCAGFVKPLSAFALEWNKPAFGARGWDGVLRSLNASSPGVSKDIVLKAPEIADDDTDVPVTVASKIHNTQMIAVVVDASTFPLAASFTFASGAEPEFTIHVKMKRTSRIRALVQADGKYYWTSREVKVTTSACAA